MSMPWGGGIARNALTVLEAVGATDAGLREVWRFLLSIDLVEEVSADLLPVDHPLLFLLAEPRHLRLRLRDALWLRLVDVPGALARRVYAQPGTLVVEVADGFCQRNAGRWRLAVDGAGAATVDATQQ